MKKQKQTIALLTAAGVGSRTHQDIPKQFLHIDNKPLIVYTLQAFQNHPSIDGIIVVCLDGWHDVLWAYAKQFNITKLKHVVSGGQTGQESIRNGILELEKFYAPDSTVIIHDGNRGLVSEEIISDALSVYGQKGSAVASIPCAEAIFVSEDGFSSNRDIPREKLYRTQTPHVWSLEKMLWAHNEAKKRHIENMTATCTLMNKLGEEIHFSKGSEINFKITTVEDIDMFKALQKSNRYDWIK